MQVNGARHQFLARSAFSQDQDRAVGGGDAEDQLEERLHRGTLSHDVLQAPLFPQLALQRDVFLFDPGDFQGELDFEFQLIHQRRRLDQIVESPHLDGPHRSFNRLVAGDQDHQRIRVEFANVLEQIEAARLGHFHVGNDQVVNLALKLLARRRNAVGSFHPVARLPEGDVQHFADGLFVIDH